MKKLMVITAVLLVICLLMPVACASAPSEEAAEGAMPAVISPGREEVYKETGTETLPSTEEELLSSLMRCISK